MAMFGKSKSNGHKDKKSNGAAAEKQPQSPPPFQSVQSAQSAQSAKSPESSQSARSAQNGPAAESARQPQGVQNARIQHSIISADTVLTGDLVSRGDIMVEGAIDGNIKCRSLTLSGEPKISGSVEADSVHICGAFDGEVRANKVVLSKNARMAGDIYQEVLEVHPGASFQGRVARLRPQAAKSAEPAKSAAGNGQER